MFKERETLLQNIAFMGIIAAINVLLSTLGAFFPVIGIFIMIFLPFFSAVVAIVCKWKYYPIYALATILVSFAATFYRFEFTIFYLIPSLFTGFLFGLCFKLKLSAVYSLLFTSLVQLTLTYLALPIIKLVYSTDIINTFLELFKLKDKQYSYVIVPSFIYLLSLAEMILSYIVLHNELNKFNKEEIKDNLTIIKLLGLMFSVLVIPFVFNFIEVSYLFMFVSLFITINVFISVIFTKNKFNIIISSILLSTGFLLIFILYSKVNMPYTFLLINTSNILLLLFSLIYNLIREKKLC